MIKQKVGKKKRPALMLIYKMCSLKSLAKLKCDSRISLYAIQ